MSFITLPGSGPVVCGEPTPALYRPIPYDMPTAETVSQSLPSNNTINGIWSGTTTPVSKLHSPKAHEPEALKLKYEHPIISSNEPFNQVAMSNAYNCGTPVSDAYQKHFTSSTSNSVTSPTLCVKENGRPLSSAVDRSSHGNTLPPLLIEKASPINVRAPNDCAVTGHELAYGFPNGYKTDVLSYDPSSHTARSNYTHYNQPHHAPAAASVHPSENIYFSPG